MRHNETALIYIGTCYDIPPLPPGAGGHPRAGAAEADRYSREGGGGG